MSVVAMSASMESTTTSRVPDRCRRIDHSASA
jgi:hypothetical protein